MLNKRERRLVDSFWNIYGKTLALHGATVQDRTIIGYTHSLSTIRPPAQFKGHRVRLISEQNPIDEFVVQGQD